MSCGISDGKLWHLKPHCDEETKINGEAMPLRLFEYKIEVSKI